MCTWNLDMAAFSQSVVYRSDMKISRFSTKKGGTWKLIKQWKSFRARNGKFIEINIAVTEIGLRSAGDWLKNRSVYRTGSSLVGLRWPKILLGKQSPLNSQEFIQVIPKVFCSETQSAQSSTKVQPNCTGNVVCSGVVQNRARFLCYKRHIYFTFTQHQSVGRERK